MKITIWLRNDKDKTDGATLRLDVKYETYDNMLVRRYGEKETQSMSAEDFIKLVQEKIASKKSANEE